MESAHKHHLPERTHGGKAALAERLLELLAVIGQLASAPVRDRQTLWKRACECLDALQPLIELPALSAKELAVLAALERAANAGEWCPTADDLLESIGFGTQSTTVAVIRRLEQRGLIRVERYQRGRRITIVSTGLSTRQPKCTASHWRDRRLSQPR